MAETHKSRRLRRRFDDEFKAQTVRLVLDEGKSVTAVARDIAFQQPDINSTRHIVRNTSEFAFTLSEAPEFDGQSVCFLL